MTKEEAIWRSLAKRTSFRLRVGFLLSSILPVFAWGALVQALVLYISRAWHVEALESLRLAAACVFTMFLIAIFSCAVFRCRRWRGTAGIQSAFARYDLTMKLNSALISAYAGKGAWPPVPLNADDGLRFDWKRIMPSFLGAVLILLCSAAAPIPIHADPTGGMPPPGSHVKLSAAIVAMEQSGVFRSEDLAHWKRQLGNIQHQPAEQWYHQSSLEAADHLLDSMKKGVGDLAQKVNQTRLLLGGLMAEPPELNTAGQQELSDALIASVEAIKSSHPGLNETLMDGLSALNSGGLESLTADDFDIIKKTLQRTLHACRQGGKDFSDGLENEGAGLPGERDSPDIIPAVTGSRAPGRDNPQGLGRDRQFSDPGTEKPKPLQTGDITRTIPGDVLGTVDTDHHLNRNQSGLQVPGKIVDQGRGEEAAWHESLLPGEQAILRKYFRKPAGGLSTDDF